MVKGFIRSLLLGLISSLGFLLLGACDRMPNQNKGSGLLEKVVSVIETESPDEYNPVHGLMVLPKNPAPGEAFSILATGGRNIRKAKIKISNSTHQIESKNSKNGDELPFWRIDDFEGCLEGKYAVSLIEDSKTLSQLEFEIAPRKVVPSGGVVWKTVRGWDSSLETIYSAWVNALFEGSDEQTSWSTLHEVTQNKERNFLFNYLSMGEDDADGKIRVLMEPDCADNPFFLRAYFAWKLGLPFGFHICDRGYLGKSPGTGQWITNETSTSKANPVLAFNSYVRTIMNGVHSGTARTALDNENSDYYPVSLNREGLRPGAVYADPYGHTLILVSWVPQTGKKPGLLLAVDAQPDKTIAIKRFWKGNFLFNTSEVVGEPGFKAFRPIMFEEGKLVLMKNQSISTTTGFAPLSLEQRKMDQNSFYLTMERIINPKPLDPEVALDDLIKALHEQLLVRVKSVSNGEAYLRAHPGEVIPMPSSAKGIFQTGGLWEDFSTPNRDLRLLIAMDAVLGFPERVINYPEDFKIAKSNSPEEVRKKLQAILEKKISGLSISYARSDGSSKELTIAEILARREAFEMGYNPNDGVEIRWGAPENSEEITSCKRKASPNQRAKMQAVRKWFSARLHPPT